MLSIGARTKFPSHSLTEMYRQGIEREDSGREGGRDSREAEEERKGGGERRGREGEREGWRGG